MEHESDGDTNRNWCTWNNPKRSYKEAGRLGNKRASRNHPDHSIIKISQNTKSRLGDLRRLSSEKPSVNSGVKNSQRSEQ